MEWEGVDTQFGRIEYHLPRLKGFRFCGSDQGFPSARGCRPFSAEKEPLALSPGATNPLKPLRPIIVWFGVGCLLMEDYLALFPGSTREKTRFMALAAAVLQQVMDLQAVVGQINGAFVPESAQESQLDALAESLGLSRLDTSAGAAVSDEAFRDFIRKKLIQWSWDGTNKAVPEIVEKIQQDANQVDNMNGTVTVTGAGTQPAPVKELFPITAGVRTT